MLSNQRANWKSARNRPNRKGFTLRHERTDEAADPEAGTRRPGFGMTGPT
jgi:hypothetical protein